MTWIYRTTSLNIRFIWEGNMRSFDGCIVSLSPMSNISMMIHYSLLGRLGQLLSALRLLGQLLSPLRLFELLSSFRLLEQILSSFRLVESLEFRRSRVSMTFLSISMSTSTIFPYTLSLLYTMKVGRLVTSALSARRSFSSQLTSTILARDPNLCAHRTSSGFIY